MPSFDIDKEEITAFDLGNGYLFTAYFDEDLLFNQLKEYYNSDKYRFEIPDGDLEQVRQILNEFYYELKIEHSLEDYCVTIDEDVDSSSILRNSVKRKHRECHEIYLMKDKLSVEQALEHGAVHIEKSEVSAEDLPWKTNGS